MSMLLRAASAVLLLAGVAGCDIVQGLLRGQIGLPRRVDFEPAQLERLKLPAGFTAGVYARELGNVRNLAFGPDGTLYATRRREGDVVALPDRDRDGRADGAQVAASGLDQVNGIAVRAGRIYLAPPTRVLVGTLAPDGGIGELAPLIRGLPEGEQHPNRTLAFGPDGMLYVSIGSSCNDCLERDDRYAAILRARPDGSDVRVHASGVRNTIGFDWHPATGDLWGMDHGADWRGPDQPPEELNRLVAGGHYGWPFCYGDQRVDAFTDAEPPGGDRQAFCQLTVPPALTYQAHSAPLDLVFYDAGLFPPAYRGDAFVSMHGSWNRQPPTGYKLVRVRFESGWPVRFEDFMTGFLSPDGQTQFGRPAGLVVAPDGALLVADDANGVIYRITYRDTSAHAPAPRADRPGTSP